LGLQGHDPSSQIVEEVVIENLPEGFKNPMSPKKRIQSAVKNKSAIRSNRRTSENNRQTGTPLQVSHSSSKEEA
jgi:hypothetical protein